MIGHIFILITIHFLGMEAKHFLIETSDDIGTIKSNGEDYTMDLPAVEENDNCKEIDNSNLQECVRMKCCHEIPQLSPGQKCKKSFAYDAKRKRCAKMCSYAMVFT